MSETYSGKCLCGSVKFRIEGPIDHMDACHCKMCQRWTGGPFIGADISHSNVAFESDDDLVWFDSSDWAKRGFCGKCGSSLFYRLKDTPDFWAINAGALDTPPEMSVGKEIFIDEKPSIYALSGDHPRLTGAEFMAMLQSSSDEAQ